MATNQISYDLQKDKKIYVSKSRLIST